MDGVLIVDKPAGPTSHDVVACVRRATGWPKIGHTGTLDPLATGVLPLVVGRATRLAQFLSADDKVYEAEVRLGWATDTYDAEGRRIEITESESRTFGPSDLRGSTSSPRPEPVEGRTLEHDLDRILDRFRGSYLQAAPPFSAKKLDGVRAYSLARYGGQARVKHSPVTVHELTCLGRSEDRLRVRLRCSSGYYVRTFAHELGLALGCGAHLSALRRVRSGEFDLAAAVPLDVVLREGEAASARLTPLDRLLPSLPAVVVTPGGAARTLHGNELRPEDVLAAPDTLPGKVRVVDEDGALLAIAEPSITPGFLHPGVVVR